MPLKRAIYAWDLLARIVRQGLNRAAPPGLTQVRIASGSLRGMRMLLDLRIEKDYWLGTYEPELQLAVKQLVEPGMVAYDIGANVGYITLLFAQAVGTKGRVFAIEALPENVERLEGNVALNAFSERVTVVYAAVVDRAGPVKFLIGPSGGMGKAQGSAGRQRFEYRQSLTVTGISLDAFAYQQGNPAPQIIKMDIEGGEVLAFPGMCEVLKKERPLLFLELHGSEAAQVAWETLTSLDYHIRRMAPGYPLVTNLDALDWKAYLLARPKK
ncbi:MAG TPA: FkbM family methyltransferase [Anaerolineales bacterium]|jgi:FkbM family methyltransferase|nr:FkbM family methyltransferase [Anaerolineales bacterium]